MLLSVVTRPHSLIPKSQQSTVATAVDAGGAEEVLPPSISAQGFAVLHVAVQSRSFAAVRLETDVMCNAEVYIVSCFDMPCFDVR